MTLRDPSPEQFLSWLDEDPRRAMDAFYRFAVRQLLAVPPRPLQGLGEDQKEDAIQEIVLHCVAQDFRVLRRFDPRRGSFAAWFHLVARNRAYDWLRSQSPLSGVEPGTDAPEPVDPAAPPDRDVWAHELIDAVRSSLQQLSDTCRALLGGAAEGLRPSELARLVGWGAESNKKASDDLRACRTRLRKHLQDRGFDLAELDELK